ncbi:MAG: PilW family protein [Thermodesulfobacteriota bacterium]|nr:PilW family protein [Thermodesulfobacteriota bacterium]
MNRGFTLVELVVSMFIAGIVLIAIFTVFKSQQKSYLIQDQVTEMQQNIRAAMDIMVRDIRMAGYSHGAPGFGITDIRPRDKAYSVDITITGNGALEFTADFDDNGTLSGGETISYSVYDFPVGTGGDGINDLGRNSGGGRQLVAENIEALGFAYAFDADGDGILDTYNVVGNQQVIWAVDSDGDNDLDRNLDTNGNGDIDENDGPGLGGNGLIGGTAIPDVNPQDIRAVHIWMLARTEHGDNSFLNTKTYTVGNKVITPNNNLRMRLLTTTVKCRNMGL